MRVCNTVACTNFPCIDMNHDAYAVPALELLKPAAIKIVLISEAAPVDPRDGYYAGGASLFARTTVEVFREAGADVSNIFDILELGVYLTTAVKCAKTAYAVGRETIVNCAALLERELALFPNARAYLLMGDVAIKAMNAVAARAGESRVIPAGPTYKLRGREFYFRGVRVFPSYLQAGPSFFIEKGKHRVMAEDIRTALQLAEGDRGRAVRDAELH
jgi:hypothetical protein